MLRIIRYAASYAAEWDAFVNASRNGTFLFLRSYMDYHRDRFVDHSMMFYDNKDRLVAVMACNEDGDTIYSHQGLTYGGFVLSKKCHAEEVRLLFDCAIDYLREHGFRHWIYKQIPTVYHRIPSQEEDYFLWRNNAQLVECNLASVVDYSSMPYLNAEYCRRNAVTRLSRQGVRLDMDARLEDFWPLLEKHLKEKYNATPVHTINEISSLQQAMPDNIKCCTAVDKNNMILAGVVVYDTGAVAHAQYSTATEYGQRIDAQDFLYMSLINHYRNIPSVRFFDIGTSNEDGGRVLNSSLNRYKEGFGARGVAYRKWKIEIQP